MSIENDDELIARIASASAEAAAAKRLSQYYTV